MGFLTFGYSIIACVRTPDGPGSPGSLYPRGKPSLFSQVQSSGRPSMSLVLWHYLGKESWWYDNYWYEYFSRKVINFVSNPEITAWVFNKNGSRFAWFRFDSIFKSELKCQYPGEFKLGRSIIKTRVPLKPWPTNTAFFSFDGAFLYIIVKF
jgi:hypothetical protein